MKLSVNEANLIRFRGRKSRDSGSVLAFPSTIRASVHVKESGGRNELNANDTTWPAREHGEFWKK